MQVLSGSLLLVTSALQATQPPAPGEIEKLRSEGKFDERQAFVDQLGNGRPSEELVERAQSKIDRARLEAAGVSASIIANVAPLPPAAWKGLPTTGSPKTLTVLIDFADYRGPSEPSVSNIYTNIYGNGSAAAQAYIPLESLNHYYQRASENQLNIQGSVIGWHHMAQSRVSYKPANENDNTASNRSIFNLIKAALQANPNINYSQFDNDNNGEIDFVNIIYAGPKGGWGSFWWGYRWSFFIPEATTTLFGGKRIKNFTWQWLGTRGNNDYNPKVLIHETGHALGLPDYYDYDQNIGPDGGLGGLDMMDANRGNHNAFSRWVLGWINPVIVGSGAPILRTLNASGDTSLVGNKAVVLFPNATNNPFNEFFIVENRRRVGNDAVNAVIGQDGYSWNAPSDGLLVWHVAAGLNASGDYLNNNSDTTRKLIKLVEADGLEEIVNGGSADAGDYYVSGNTLSSSSRPDSLAYSGAVTNISISNISANDRVMTAAIGFGAPSVSQAAAAPVFTPAGGAYSSAISVTMTCATSGATIRYTTNGTAPTAYSAIYTGAIPVSSYTTIKACAFKTGLQQSPVAAATYAFITPEALVNGVAKTSLSGVVNGQRFYSINVPAGEGALNISISGGTGDCDLYIKRGSLPTQNSYDYRPYLEGNNESVTISNPVAGMWYVMLRAYQPYSGVNLLASYARNLAIVGAPAFSLPSGTYTGAISVNLTCPTPGASIYFTTNGSEPTMSSSPYLAPLQIATFATLKARAFKTGFTPSSIVSASYTINDPVTITALTDGVPVLGLAGATGSHLYFKITVPSSQGKLEFRMSGGTGDCDLYVRRGALPTTSVYDSRPYTNGNNESVDVVNPVSSVYYVMLYGYAGFTGVTLKADYMAATVETPVFTPAPGNFDAPVNVSLTCATAGAAIRYTLDGSTPTAASALYSSPILVSSSNTIAARAFASGKVDSAVTRGTYTVNQMTITTMVNGITYAGISGATGSKRYFQISVPSGQATLDIRIAGGTGDCDLYVRRGGVPTTSVYDYRPYKDGNNELAHVSNPAAGVWYIMLNGYNAYSGVSVTGQYGQYANATSTPVLSPGPGTYSGSVTVGMTCATSGAAIRYTLDGSVPTAASTLYLGPITISSSTLLKVRAFMSGYLDSVIVGGSYTINGPQVTTLYDGIAQTNLSGASGSLRYFKITVPTGQAKLEFRLSGGTGDCDLYVRRGYLPTKTVYDYRPYTNGNNETVSMLSPQGDVYYVMLSGYASYSTVSLVADYTPALTNVSTPVFTPTPGVYFGTQSVTISCATPGAIIRYTVDGSSPTASSPVYMGALSIVSTATIKAMAFKDGFYGSGTATGTYTINNSVTSLGTGSVLSALWGTQSSTRQYQITVPSGMAQLDIGIFGGTGDCDLYVRRGAMPTLSTYDYRPYKSGNNELVSISYPVAGTYYIMVNGYASYTGMGLFVGYTTIPVVTITPSNNYFDGLHGLIGYSQYFRVVVPSGIVTLNLATEGGTGDCDLYLRKGLIPVTNGYDEHSAVDGNGELISLSNPIPGQYFLRVYGYDNYDGVTLQSAFNAF